MTFHWPLLLWLLVLPLVMAIAELRRRAGKTLQHPKILRAEAGTEKLTLSSETNPSTPEARLRWRLCLGMLLVIVALARPQWGKLDEPVFDQSREIIIALDLSRSMLADDVRPSRLDRAKLLVSSLLEQLRGERVGLVVFSGTAFLQSPLSADYEILRDFLPSLNPNYLPEGGTNYAALLNASLNAFGASGSADRFLVILSDGEATDDDWKPAVEELKKKGIRVLGFGVGTAAGSMIPDGSGAFVKDERGAVVLSKLESTTLQQLATDTNGVYADASSWVDIAQIVENTVAAGKKGNFVERSRVRLAERFQWALAPALFFILWSFYREFRVRPRIRDVKYIATPTTPNLNPAPNNVQAQLRTLIFILLSTTAFYSAAPSAARAAEKEPPSGDTLTKLVASLSQKPALNAHDYADFAHSTISYGKDLQGAQKHVPAGPVNDALAAVDEGERLDPKAADWPKLRSELEALLKKKEQPQQQQPQQSPQDKKDEQKKKEEQQQQQQPQQPQQKQNNQDQKQNQPQDQKQPQQQPSDPAQKPPPDKQSAFGDMKDKSQEKSEKPPQPTDPTEQQKVGGAQEKKEAGTSNDPSLAMPLQKLEQLKDQDSPAKLYQLMQGQHPEPKKAGKNW
jgi:Ca-activated chloride channel family protein